jgi:GDPmannose 4,6-dehydratase
LSRIKVVLQDCLYLGNLDTRRDWGHARDYVEMQWLMLQQDKPEDFVIATGEQHSVREFVERAASHLDMEISWRGEGTKEEGFDQDGVCRVKSDPRYFRPTEVDTLLDDSSKAKAKPGWKPKTSFEDLVKEMVDADLELARRDALVAREGFRAFNYRE